MRELTFNELEFISAGVKPIDNAESEVGKVINDVYQLTQKIGAWLGSAIYDALH